MGVNVALARAYPSSPAMATVFHPIGLVVPLASSAANSRVGDGLTAGEPVGEGLAGGLAEVLDVATADADALAVAEGGLEEAAAG